MNVYEVDYLWGGNWKRNRVTLEAKNPVQAAEIALEYEMKTKRRKVYRIYVLELVISGKPGICKAADSNGSKRYDVKYPTTGEKPFPIYSEYSFA